ncbi:MAG TPA: beta-N-acetylhexosaminidase [Bryobacterales bacterium]|nr:beta-N-acetylhexosaminidase [Bryobacterales bacterium]
MTRTLCCALLLAVCALLPPAPSQAATVSPLFARGYTVIPEPQQVTLGASELPFDSTWRLELGPGVQRGDVAVESFNEDLEKRFRLRLTPQGGPGGVVRLSIVPGSVTIGRAQDRNHRALAEQAYKIELRKDNISITANAGAGLFYGVETLVQLLKKRGGSLWLPEGQIVDWPDLERRHIYWDDAHHLDRLDALKRAIRQAAFFKANGFVIKLEGHFQYKSAPALVEPYALSPAELQALTDYGLRYYVQLIPYLDGPAHIAFILKHPEYAALRSFPDSNYELCATNPDSYKLLFGMYQDLLDANRGVKYFYLSTDEPYYIGLADNPQCQEKAAAARLGSVGKLLAEFTAKTANFLHERGRTVMFWGEYPMKPADLAALPSHLVNGETYGPQFDPIFKARGIREMIYTSSEGEEKLFPNYFILPASKRLHAGRGENPRVEETFDKISFDSSRKDADLMGEINAGWADMGLHPETFWLGYATASGTAWHPGSPDPRESMSTFYPLFYGPDVVNMDQVYQLLSTQAQLWSDSWETVASTARKPIFGNSDNVYKPRRPAHDQSLPLPPAPAPENLRFASTWAQENAKRLQLASEFLQENDELLGLVRMNLERASFNRYNLEVFLAVARLCRQNLEMLLEIGRMNTLLESAQAASQNNQPRRAVAALDQAIAAAEKIRRGRNRALRDATATWYKSWHPRVAEANGRRFLHEVDDVKDHLPDRTVDMSYLVYRELLLPFGDWVNQIVAARNHYASANHLPARAAKFDWQALDVPD